MDQKHVFYDPEGKRHRKVSFVLRALGVLAAIVTTLFGLSLFVAPFLPPVKGLTLISHPFAKMAQIAFPNAKHRQSEFLLSKARKALLEEIAGTKKLVAPLPKSAGPIVAAYYAPWQETGLHSLRSNASKLTDLMPEWLHLGSDGRSIDIRDWDPNVTPHNLDVVAIARQNQVRILPLLNNSVDGVFDPRRAHALLGSQANQQSVATALKSWLLKQGFQGIQVDLENLSEGDAERLPGFLEILRKTFQGSGLLVTCAIESSFPDQQLPRIASPCDFVVLMAYDEHWEEGPPGPIASIQWFDGVVKRGLRSIPNDKLVVGIGNYAYDWAEGARSAESKSYQEALVDAAGYRPDERPQDVVDFDPKALNATFEYEDDNGKPHTVWMLDAPSAFNQWSLVLDHGVRGAALWALGSEDPGVWKFMNRATYSRRPDARTLQEVQFPYEVEFDGKGEILTIASRPSTGARNIDVDPTTGMVTDSSYTKYPSSYLIHQTGEVSKNLVLSFDDGPDPTFTPEILDVLAKYHVPAVFFVIGQNAEKSPELLERMMAEGHEVGSHTFTHPNLGAVSERREELELNATQRAIQSITGRSTTLFRPPYNADAEPRSAEEVRPLDVAANLGYITVGEKIDPQDWNATAVMPDGSTRARTAAEIAKLVIDQVNAKAGNVILLHDGGGDRTQTVRALEEIVPTLQKEGYRFVSVAQLAGMTRDQAMPPLSAKELAIIGFDKAVFWALFTFESLLGIAFVVAICLGVIRVLISTPLAVLHDRRQRKSSIDPNYEPSVTALIAAYNEEAVVDRTVRSVLASDYPIGQVIVIDDGSTDDTGKSIQRHFSDDPRVCLITKENGGKASALNRGILQAEGEILLCIDADTQLPPDAVRLLIQGFKDPKVGAVAGNVRVGNVDGVLTTWQSIEYTTSQNVDRKAYALLNAITVVPGAIGAWRKEAVESVGGYSADTLAEDMDLTMRLRRAGWRQETESRAKAYTEAPDTFRGFFRQRFRWAFGTLQCLWKHRKAIGHDGFFGWVVLPLMWVFQILLQALAPLVDLQMLFSIVGFLRAWLVSGLYQSDWQPLTSASHSLIIMGFLYGLFFALELTAAIIAYRMDRERLGSLGWLFLQRFVYRQLMYGVMYRSLLRALTGRRQGWGKLDRKASVVVGR